MEEVEVVDEEEAELVDVEMVDVADVEEDVLKMEAVDIAGSSSG